MLEFAPTVPPPVKVVIAYIFVDVVFSAKIPTDPSTSPPATKALFNLFKLIVQFLMVLFCAPSLAFNLNNPMPYSIVAGADALPSLKLMPSIVTLSAPLNAQIPSCMVPAVAGVPVPVVYAFITGFAPTPDFWKVMLLAAVMVGFNAADPKSNLAVKFST